MKTLFLALVAGLAVVVAGCEAEQAPDAGAGEQTEAEVDDLTVGPNGWQPQSQQLDCATGVSNKFSKTSRRHVYSFPGQAGQTTTFTLSGNWPASLGARLYVVGPSGKVLATDKAPSSNQLSLKITFSSSGKYSVYASPIKYQQVDKSYGYKLGASCDVALCATASVQWEGSPTSTYYAQNVASAADADAFFAGFPAGSTFGTLTGACDQGWACTALYKPVCGVIKSNPAKTFSNACSFAAAVRSDAGGVPGQSSKGYIQSEGACAVACNYDDPTKNYVVHGAEMCKLAKFACPAGQSGFSDECGCGCLVPLQRACLAGARGRPACQPGQHQPVRQEHQGHHEQRQDGELGPGKDRQHLLVLLDQQQPLGPGHHQGHVDHPHRAPGPQQRGRPPPTGAQRHQHRRRQQPRRDVAVAGRLGEGRRQLAPAQQQQKISPVAQPHQLVRHRHPQVDPGHPRPQPG